MRVHRTNSQSSGSVKATTTPKRTGKTRTVVATPGDSFTSGVSTRSLTSSSNPTLALGAQGDSVAKLQRLLAQQGFNPGSADGDFGSRTEAALCAFQRKAGLDDDGICGPATWAALQGSVFEKAPVDEVSAPAASDSELRQRILKTAQAEVGTVEATGNNDGDVLKYPEAFGRGSEPYCADFVSWVFTQSGKDLDYCYVPSLREHLEETGQWKGQSNPQPGDIVIFDFEGEGEGDHVGIVKEVKDDGTIITIEGNTGADDALSDSSSDQSGVWNRARTMDQILGFANP